MVKQDNHFFYSSFTTLYNIAAALMLLLLLLLVLTFSSNKQIQLREGVGKMANIKTAKDILEVSILSLAN